MVPLLPGKLALAKKIVTLDIDSTAIRLLSISGHRVHKWACAPVMPGMIEDGAILDPQALGETVRHLMRTSGIVGKKVVASINGLYSVGRILSLPTVTEEPVEEDTLVLQVARRLMPVSADELYFSWQVLSTNQVERRVLFVGMLKDLVDTQVQALRAVGINPYIMELKGLALVRAVNRTQALVVNIEPDSVDIAVVSGGSPYIVRTVAQQSNLAVEDRARKVMDALEHTVEYYNSQYPHSRVDETTPLFLAGAVVESEGIRDIMEAGVAYPIESITIPLVECSPELPVSQYAVNIGLALRVIQ